MWQFKFILTCVNYKILDELNFFHRKFSQLLINRSIVPSKFMMEFAKEKSCLYYPISYWLIMKYKYANRIFYIW